MSQIIPSFFYFNDDESDEMSETDGLDEYEYGGENDRQELEYDEEE